MELKAETNGTMQFMQMKIKELLKYVDNNDHYKAIIGDGYQRDINDSHRNKVASVLKKKIQNNETLSMIPIYISVRTNGEEYVVDGQHRINALDRISKEISDEEEKSRFLETKFNVIIIPNSSVNRERELFLELNYYGKNVNSSLATVIETTMGHLKDNEEKAKNLIELLYVKSNPLKGKFRIGASVRGELSYRTLYSTLSLLFKHELKNFTEEQAFFMFDSLLQAMETKWNSTLNIYRNVGWFTLFFTIKEIWKDQLSEKENINNIIEKIENSVVTEENWERGGMLLRGSSMSIYRQNAKEIIKQK